MNLVEMFECWSYAAQWYLVEMLLDIPPSQIKWDDFVVPEKNGNPGDWQCPYMEQYLNSDGTEQICNVYEVPHNDTNPARIAFFLYKSSGKLLKTPYGEFELNAEGEAPDRLKSILAFEED